MRKQGYHTIFLLILTGFLLTACGGKKTGEVPQHTDSKDLINTVESLDWKAEWITASDQTDTVNSWTVFRKEIELEKKPEEPMFARIAVDSKYWLWINGEIIVREGGLKRGPTPEDTYFDIVDVSNHLKAGNNTIAVLVQYFGKDGFSHKSSGMAGLIFDLQAENLQILSNTSWKAWLHESFGETEAPYPNFRLPESNILFDANKGGFAFTKHGFDASGFPAALQKGIPPVAPWNNLVMRPIPLWKDFGLNTYANNLQYPFTATGDTIWMELPYNAQVNPYLKIESETGNDTIDIRTDHYYGGGPPNVRGIYISKPGVQEFELPGWINGHNVKYHIPEGVKILVLKYRETGYNTEFAGSFFCDDPYFNRLWQKSLRTLYVTMRDTYMDCPDRERAQWWGDEVLESGEAFYALDRKSDGLVKKGILELMDWQRKDSTIFSPVPAGNWDKELPGQMLASVGYYGFYNYYLHTGDQETIAKVYEPVKKYLSLWKLKENGTVEIRQGGWIWGDWGENKDIPLLINTQYYLAQKGLMKMAEALGKQEEARRIQEEMNAFRKAFNRNFWKGDHYRSGAYEGETDDRSQALAVVSGLPGEDKFPAIYKVLKTERHASPYMEKYVVEALFQMGYPEFALQRLKDRFYEMVTHPTITTLWEGWGIGKEGFGGGTTNHAWSGGGLTLLSQYVAGIEPTSPAYKTFRVWPRLGGLKHVKARVPSIRGDIVVEIKKDENYSMNLTVPENTSASVYIPDGYQNINLNGKKIAPGQNIKNKEGFYMLSLEPGEYNILAE